MDFFVINLDRSPERLADIRADMAAEGIDLIRIAGVDGKTIPEDERPLLDLPAFLRRHGKRPVPGEYGCYLSHLQAIEAIAAGGAEMGVVFEDDVRPRPGMAAVLRALAERDDWDVVRFAHHRRPWRRRLRALPEGRRLSAALFGPTGSAAAYMVRRSAAAKLARALRPMSLPFDVALERGWANEVRTLDVWPDLVAFAARSKTSQIEVGGRYGARKLKPWRRLPTLLFRTSELVRRVTYALGAGRRR
ncbi:glycosyl transferase family 25 [Aureimonas flava]|uniref:Glycosyl transferase family 25 n=1 Tax=Aureimonas flava TaxID=2320271 RepID=A0A3A1WND0_9HYPH|nr:glycosyltransferase family 25 protein [Aureimonas flava]RIY03408.1 glycosyl transferase family 25 [Aureimonas flava]